MCALTRNRTHSPGMCPDRLQPMGATAKSLTNTEAVEVACYPSSPAHQCHLHTTGTLPESHKTPGIAGEPPSQWLPCNSRDTSSSKAPATPGGASSNHKGTWDTFGTDPAWWEGVAIISNQSQLRYQKLKTHPTVPPTGKQKGLQLPT